MIVQSPVQSAEVFHLALLGVLQVRLNQEKYVLKGGGNLRFFFGSPRYSEDMDFDAVGIGRWKLEEKVDEILDSRALVQTIGTRGLAIAGVSKPKQTDTTQRWKVTLITRQQREPFWTKVEFSHRGSDGESQLAQVRSGMAEKYALRPPTARHYLPQAMIVQKIGALAERAETQARDIFDLDYLFRQNPGEGTVRLEDDLIDLAIQRAVELPFEAYRRQVIEFMEPEVVELYDNERAWDDMRRNVIERLERLR